MTWPMTTDPYTGGNEQELPRKEWNDVVDRYRNDMPFTAGEHERMSERQKWFIHEIDKSNERLQSNNK